MKKTIFFTITILFCANTQGMEKGRVAEMRKLFEAGNAQPAVPKDEIKVTRQPKSEQEHLADTFPKGNPSKELSDNDDLRDLLRILYPKVYVSSPINKKALSHL
jgi:hypothetical protein